jgi:hypothetical protein
MDAILPTIIYQQGLAVEDDLDITTQTKAPNILMMRIYSGA